MLSTSPDVSPGPTAEHSAPRAEPTQAFRDLFEAEFSYVCRALKRLGVQELELEDLAQEVFVAVHQKLDRYDPSRPLRPWLFAFAFRAASNHLRLARHRREVADGTVPEAAHGRTPERALTDQQARATVLEALQDVPLERRSVLILHDIDGFTAPDIAESLSIPVNTVYSRLRIARDDFKRALWRLELQRGER